jgi:hypothetical protein
MPLQTVTIAASCALTIGDGWFATVGSETTESLPRFHFLSQDHYRELIRFFGDDDPSTKRMLEWILFVEESTPASCTICS